MDVWRKNARECNMLNGASQAKPDLFPAAGIKNLFVLTFSFLFLFHAKSQTQLQPIGQWREHLPYQNTIQVVLGGNEIYAATINNVFSVDDKNNISRYSKVTGLNDVGVSAIAWDDASQQLVIAYSNSNIDVLKNKFVKNISDIKRSTISGSKAINYIYCKNRKAYLCSGLGVIVVDLVKYEITDTWQIGSNGSQVKINGFTSDNNFFYAATDEGLKRATIASAILADYRNWQNITTFRSEAVRMVTTLADKIVALKNDSIYVVNGNTSTLFYADAQWPILSMSSSSGKLLVTQRTAAGASRVLVLNNNGVIEKNLNQAGIISSPRWALQKDNAIWVADFFGGLSKFENNAFERYIPEGPLGTASGEMVVNKNTLYVAAGEVNDAWNKQFNRNGIYKLSGDRWSNIGAFNTPSLDSVLDFITVAIDPKDESSWAGSYGGGLVNISPSNAVKIYKQNSTLKPAIGDPTSYRVSGLAFDKNGSLWISNYGASQNLNVRKADGTFKAFGIPFFHFENSVSQIVIDDANQIWIVSPRGNGVFVYNSGENIDALNDDKWKYFRVGAGSGNLPSNEVYSLAKDKNGFIWIGTAAGIGIVQCPEQVFEAGGCEAILPIVQQDQFAGFLFQNEEVKTIAVDGANRKWIGTRNGVWLISADGDKIIYRFTEENSPLLSNDVKKITIDPQNGEVYISTFKGICSFRGTATDATTNTSKVLIYPNPVPPGFSGTIAIRNVPENGTVKIAELNGRLVFQTRALGGQATWNGRNYKGDKVASGIYLVLVKDDLGIERQVSKIVIVSGR